MTIDERELDRKLRHRAGIAFLFGVLAELAIAIYVLDMSTPGWPDWKILLGCTLIILSTLTVWTLLPLPSDAKYARVKSLVFLNPCATAFFLGVALVAQRQTLIWYISLGGFGVAIAASLMLAGKWGRQSNDV